MIKKLTLLFSTLSIIVVAEPVRNQETAQEHVMVLAQVVAYNLSLSNLVELTSTPNNDVVLVRVDRSLTGDIKARYLIVRYEYWADESPLPQGFRDQKSQWKLELTRDSKCDSQMEEVLSREKAPGLVLVPGQGLDPDTHRKTEALPCYRLRPNGLTRYQEHD